MTKEEGILVIELGVFWESEDYRLSDYNRIHRWMNSFWGYYWDELRIMGSPDILSIHSTSFLFYCMIKRIITGLVVEMDQLNSMIVNKNE